MMSVSPPCGRHTVDLVESAADGEVVLQLDEGERDDDGEEAALGPAAHAFEEKRDLL